jgi:hypothetical protein
VVARVKEVALAELAAEAAAKQAELKRAAAAAAGKGSSSKEAKKLKLLAGEVASLRGGQVAAVKDKCAAMASPGTVMGEDELQALADVRQACVQVRSLICVRQSSDHGALLDFKTYRPRNAPAAVAAGADAGAAGLGRGNTLVLLQEMRAHRMSHYQLVRLPMVSPPPSDALHNHDVTQLD